MSGSTSSGLYNFSLSNGSAILEAFDRLGIRPTEIDSHMMLSARTSMNLEFSEWEDASISYWKVVSGTINLVAGQATYTMPTNLVTIEEVVYTTVNALGSGVNSDRIMIPIQRSSYAEIVNKLQPGIPTQYWYQMTFPQQITIWEVPAAGQVAPNFVLSWYGLQQMQDAANLGMTETPDAPRRSLDALCAKMALRLAEKFGPKDPVAKKAVMDEKASLASRAWELMQRRDQEPGPIIFQPRIGVYGRMK
jgi:hypothetical protein